MILRSILFLLLTYCSNTYSANYVTKPPPLYEQIALENKVPAKLFYAIILNESRSIVSLEKSKSLLPWPWTVNHRGQGYYFETREAAYRYIKPYVERGESLGIGLGQIEWKWHKDKFESLWDVLDPQKNLSVSARILRRQFERKECSTWTLAIGCYHRPAQGDKDKAIAKVYTNKVLRIWKRLI
jgi:hypothetical protein